MKERNVYGYKVKYEENAKMGIRYLAEDLDRKEAQVFFDQARLKGEAPFEDDQERQFTLIYNRDRTFTLIRR